MRVFCRLVIFFGKEMEKRCFFFTIVIQAFRSLLLLPLLMLPTAAATTSCHCTGTPNILRCAYYSPIMVAEV